MRTKQKRASMGVEKRRKCDKDAREQNRRDQKILIINKNNSEHNNDLTRIGLTFQCLNNNNKGELNISFKSYLSFQR